MNNARTIAKLQALLQRVRSRTRGASTEVATVSTAAAGAPLDDEPEITVDVDVADPVSARGATRDDSAERLLAVAPADANTATGWSSIPPPDAEAQEASADDVPTASVREPAVPADESGPALDERPPASSRRPVALAGAEQIGEIAFEGGELPPPRHTPPPESGRLPAAPADEFEDAEPIRERPVEPAARPVPLAAEPTRAHLPSGAEVVDLVGDARRFAPKTFLEWLDEALSL